MPQQIQNQDGTICEHPLTLMRHMLETWLSIDGGKDPPIQRVYCPSCKRAMNVDWSLAVRGDYYCDGSEVIQYQAHRFTNPGILEVLHDRPVRGERLDALAVIVCRLHDALEELNLWIFENAEAPQD